MDFKKIKKIEKGWSSYIWLAKNKKGAKLVIKEVREKSPRKDLAEREGKMLLLANSVGVGPKIIEVNYEKNFVAMEYINGLELANWIFSEEFKNEVTKEQYWNFIKELCKQCIALNKINLSHNQLEGGKNILVVKKTNPVKNKNKLAEQNTNYFPVIIDFEKATIKEKRTKNLGQIENMFFHNPHSAIAKKSREKLGAKL